MSERRRPCQRCGAPKPPGRGQRYCERCRAELATEYVDRSSGRVRIYLGGKDFTYRSRAVMEAHLGRPLDSDEHVHHVNGDVADDRVENLEIVSNAEHWRMHREEREETRRAKLPDYQGCRECGSRERPYYSRGYCQRCYHRLYRLGRLEGAIA